MFSVDVPLIYQKGIILLLMSSIGGLRHLFISTHYKINRSFGDGRLSLLVFLRIDDDSIIPERDRNQNVMVKEKKISDEYTDHAALNFSTSQLRRRSRIKKRYFDYIMNTPPSSFHEDAE